MVVNYEKVKHNNIAKILKKVNSLVVKLGKNDEDLTVYLNRETFSDCEEITMFDKLFKLYKKPTKLIYYKPDGKKIVFYNKGYSS